VTHTHWSCYLTAQAQKGKSIFGSADLVVVIPRQKTLAQQLAAQEFDGVDLGNGADIFP
jgi:hypothetical protein